MIDALLDTGPMLAIIDPSQDDVHAKCVAQLRAFRGEILTTWPCIAEAMHAAEEVDCNKVFTLDSDFRIDRFKGSGYFEIVPE